MDVSSIGVCSHDERVVAFRKTHAQLIADPVCFFRCDLARFERLADLIGNNIVLWALPGDVNILPLLKKKLFISCHRIAGIAGNEFAFFCLLRILCIIRSLTEAVSYGFSFSLMQGDQSCCCHLFLLITKKCGDRTGSKSDTAPGFGY